MLNYQRVVRLFTCKDGVFPYVKPEGHVGAATKLTKTGASQKGKDLQRQKKWLGAAVMRNGQLIIPPP